MRRFNFLDYRKARQRLREEEPRDKIYCLTQEKSRNFRRCRNTLQALDFPSLSLPPILAINTWQALSKYLDANQDGGAVIALDLQQVNRASHAFKSRLFEADAFQSLLDYTSIFLEMLYAEKDYLSALTLLERWNSLQESLFLELIKSYAERSQDSDLDRVMQMASFLVEDFDANFATPFYMGHELGHHLGSVFTGDVMAFRGLAFDLFSREAFGNAIINEGEISDQELLFNNGKLLWIRKYRAGKDDMMAGLREAVKRYQLRLEEDIEPFCDFAGLIFAVHTMMNHSEIVRIPLYWLALAQSSEMLFYLRYLAAGLYPAPCGWVRFSSSQNKRRFITSAHLLIERLGTSKLLNIFGWSTKDKANIRKHIKPALDGLKNDIELLDEKLYNTFIGSLSRCFDSTQVHPPVEESDVHNQVDTSDLRALFVNVPNLPNWLVGYAFALDLACDIVAPRFASSGERTQPDLDENEKADLAKRILSFRENWRRYVYRRIEELN